jgi:hypothetical protein
MGAGASTEALAAKYALPDAIDAAMGESVRAHMQAFVDGDVDSYYPEVLVSYATGHRKDVDAPGCGPGMYYAKATVDALQEAGIGTFSGLHVGAGTDWKVFLDKLGGRFSECKLLVVVVTPALFLSKPCLVEIATAQKADVRVLPVLFENPMTAPRDQWPMITKADQEGKLMLLAVQSGFGELNVMPSPPGDIVSQPSVMVRVVDEVLKELGQERAAIAPTAHSSAVSSAGATHAAEAGAAQAAAEAKAASLKQQLAEATAAASAKSAQAAAEAEAAELEQQLAVAQAAAAAPAPAAAAAAAGAAGDGADVGALRQQLAAAKAGKDFKLCAALKARIGEAEAAAAAAAEIAKAAAPLRAALERQLEEAVEEERYEECDALQQRLDALNADPGAAVSAAAEQQEREQQQQQQRAAAEHAAAAVAGLSAEARPKVEAALAKIKSGEKKIE